MQRKLVVCETYEQARREFNLFTTHYHDLWEVNTRNLTVETSDMFIKFAVIKEARDIVGTSYNRVEFASSNIDSEILTLVLTQFRPIYLRG